MIGDRDKTGEVMAYDKEPAFPAQQLLQQCYDVTPWWVQ